MEIFIIGDHDTVTGFSLAGIEGRSVTGSNEAYAAIKEASQSDKIGILLITERIAHELRNELDEIMMTQRFPLVVEIPDIEGPIEEKVTISDLVKTAIGIKI
jgi:V/A-type H+-transporting ATPase subunit F